MYGLRRNILRFLVYIFRKQKAEIKTTELKEGIRKMTKLANSTLIDHKALIKADFAGKGMNLKEYCKEVMDELSDFSGDEDSRAENNQNVSPNYSQYLHTDLLDDYGMIELFQ